MAGLCCTTADVLASLVADGVVGGDNEALQEEVGVVFTLRDHGTERERSGPDESDSLSWLAWESCEC